MQLSVVEVDRDTGQVTPLRHVTCDDAGVIVNPMIVEGQVHGGVASGITHALGEVFVYDDDGNPLGAKSIGESGTIGATPAVHNAVVDALSHLGVRHVELHCTPERVWRHLQHA